MFLGAAWRCRQGSEEECPPPRDPIPIRHTGFESVRWVDLRHSSDFSCERQMGGTLATPCGFRKKLPFRVNPNPSPYSDYAPGPTGYCLQAFAGGFMTFAVSRKI